MNDQANLSPQGPFKVGVMLYAVIGWLGVAFFTVFSISAFMSGDYWYIAILAMLLIMSVYMVMEAGYYLIDGEGISHRNKFGVYRIEWSEIDKIVVGPSDGTLVLQGKDKRFVLAAPGLWSGPQKPAAQAYLQNKLAAMGIASQPHWAAFSKTHKNVKLPRAA